MAACSQAFGGASRSGTCSRPRAGVDRRVRLGPQRADPVVARAARGTRPGRRARGSSGGSSRRSRRAATRPAPRSRSRSPRRSPSTGRSRAKSPPGCAPIGTSHTASTRCAGMRTWSDHARRSSTTRSTVTIAPRRAPSAPHTPSSSGGATATLPARSATGACRIATSACSGASSPTAPERRVDLGEAVVVGHRRSRDRAGGHRRQPARAGLEPLREREERPVLDLDRARRVAALEPRVRREVRERVARVAGDDLAPRDRRGRTARRGSTG